MLIKNARLVDANGERPGGLRIEDGRIAAVGEGLCERPGEEVVDAAGLTVLPAFIDLHCHFRTPASSTRRTSPPEAARPRAAATRSSTAWRTQSPCARAPTSRAA